MRNKEKITVSVFNTTNTESKNYITSIEMPKYKQMGRTVNYLREYIKTQSAFDETHRRIRYYVFESKSNFIFKEVDLSAYSIG